MLRAIILVLILAAALVAGYRLSSFHEEAGPAIGNVPVARAPAPGPEAEDAAPAVEPPPPAQTDEARPTPKVRDVTPEGVFSGPVSPYRPRPVETSPPPPEEPKIKRYFRVVVQDAGTLKAGTRTISLAGIDVPAGDEVCQDDKGADWPCGRAAKAALTLFLRGRAIDCETISGDGNRIAATCRSGEDDLARWLVAQGWARPSEGSGYAEEAKTARRGKLGLYQAEWRSAPAPDAAGRASGPGRSVTGIVQD